MSRTLRTYGLNLFLSTLVFSGCFQNSQAWALGSKKPKNTVATPSPRSIKKVIAIRSVNARGIFNNAEGDGDFEALLKQHFISLLLESGRYSVKISDSSSSALLATLSDEGNLRVQELDSQMSLMTTSCRLPQEQLLLDADVLSFEVVSRSGLRFGLGAISRLVGIGLDFNMSVKKAMMSFGVSARDPFLQRILASTIVDQKQTEKTINLTLTYNDIINAGFDRSSKTPLSKMIRGALTQGVKQIDQQMSSLSWTGRVLFHQGSSVMINVGEDAGVKVGDRFTVLTHTPSEDPSCREVPGDVPPQVPVARVEVYHVGLTDSWAKVVENVSSYPIETGSKVVIDALIQ